MNCLPTCTHKIIFVILSLVFVKCLIVSLNPKWAADFFAKQTKGQMEFFGFECTVVSGAKAERNMRLFALFGLFMCAYFLYFLFLDAYYLQLFKIEHQKFHLMQQMCALKKGAC